MVPWVLKGIMGYFKVSWVQGLGLEIWFETSINLLWSVCLCFRVFVLSLWSVLVLIWEGHPLEFKKSKQDDVKGFVFSYSIREIGPPNLFLDRLSAEQLPNSSRMHPMKLLLKMYNKFAKFL